MRHLQKSLTILKKENRVDFMKSAKVANVFISLNAQTIST